MERALVDKLRVIIATRVQASLRANIYLNFLLAASGAFCCVVCLGSVENKIAPPTPGLAESGAFQHLGH